MTKHRKLFLNPQQNATVPCPDICVPTCPFGCGPFPTASSELPPPPPPPLPTATQNSAPGASKNGEHISPLGIGIVIFFAACFIVITLYLLTARFRRRRWDFLRRGELQRGPTTTEEFLDENHGPTGIDYPIWYINTIGLRPAVIDSITIFRYKKGDRLIEGTECSVCLNEFCEDDSLRLLPKCSHAFHIPCIDTWLRSHVNCPVCRAGIVSGSIPAASNALNSNSMGTNEDSQVDSTNQIGEAEIAENRAETGEVDQMVEVHERKMDDGNSEEQSEPLRLSFSVDSSLPLHFSTEHDDDDDTMIHVTDHTME